MDGIFAELFRDSTSGDYLHPRGIHSGENLHTATIRADRCENLLLPRQVIPTNPVILLSETGHNAVSAPVTL
jgi:hypothetical protein